MEESLWDSELLLALWLERGEGQHGVCRGQMWGSKHILRA